MHPKANVLGIDFLVFLCRKGLLPCSDSFDCPRCKYLSEKMHEDILRVWSLFFEFRFLFMNEQYGSHLCYMDTSSNVASFLNCISDWLYMTLSSQFNIHFNLFGRYEINNEANIDLV